MPTLSFCVVTMPSSSISHLYTSLNVDTISRAEAGAWAAKPLMMLYSWVMTPKALLLVRASCNRARVYKAHLTLGLSNGLLALLHNLVGCVLWPADDNGAVRCGGHDQGSEECNKEGEDGEAHCVWFCQVAQSCAVEFVESRFVARSRLTIAKSRESVDCSVADVGQSSYRDIVLSGTVKGLLVVLGRGL